MTNFEKIKTMDINELSQLLTRIQLLVIAEILKAVDFEYALSKAEILHIIQNVKNFLEGEVVDNAEN